jgi:hypothetical protein
MARRRGRGIITRTGDAPPTGTRGYRGQASGDHDAPGGGTTKQAPPTTFRQLGPEDSGITPYGEEPPVQVLSQSGNKFSTFKP